ncbi:LysR family transcriptional regulator [Engelhardtia mirabilis]|uniref:Transcriptional activator protein NhaR n=1 Tax=Engelhardtia mirabilis TaxID=2528011 RepID=A0A518BN14_9BACT|nr:Transcriptional activator protein NhaR [Planctomycetes bacterium Pla133]QDV02662.1 Transcriptional activator protein NhaR [Planctomycetes bacterium Pla86]
MEWLNYHHLLYFWTVARAGSIAAASQELHVGRPAISMQLKSLEAFFGTPLFLRRGRRLELTETGKLVEGYASEIFRTGRELVEVVRGSSLGRRQVVRVGIADVMAKLIAFALLDSAFSEDDDVHLVLSEDSPRRLFAALAVHELDLVLSDVALAPGLDVRARSHRVGSSTTTLFASPELAARLAPGFPGSLDGAPFLLPSRESAVRASLDRWFESERLRPRTVAEFDDSALMKVFGQAGRGAFPGPTAVAEQIVERYGVRALGVLPTVTERYWAISPERKIAHPAVARIVEGAAAVFPS